MGYGTSQYVKNMENSAVTRFDREMKKREIKQQIASGMTLERAKQQMSAEEIEIFKEISEELKQEESQGQAFLAGFSNPDFRNK